MCIRDRASIWAQANPNLAAQRYRPTFDAAGNLIIKRPVRDAQGNIIRWEAYTESATDIRGDSTDLGGTTGLAGIAHGTVDEQHALRDDIFGAPVSDPFALIEELKDLGYDPADYVGSMDPLGDFIKDYNNRQAVIALLGHAERVQTLEETRLSQQYQELNRLRVKAGVDPLTPEAYVELFSERGLSLIHISEPTRPY